ncbi:MAG: hypothetical protein HUJ88_06835 [Fusobacterium necrophorum]|nr:hypothetical protein [Fusobacterium necrophorum]
MGASRKTKKEGMQNLKANERIMEIMYDSKETISIPRYALRKYPREVLLFIFGLLPEFSKNRDSEASLFLTESELIEKTALYAKELQACMEVV